MDPFSIDGIPIEFLSSLSYVHGNRIRVDSKNNKWVITHHGVWVIQESMGYWHPDARVNPEEGMHPENCGLLSDVVYDVAFDNKLGLAYLSTDKGISVLQIPFAEDPSIAEDIYISPNPFIVPEDEFVIIKNITKGSTIQIMTITGLIMKKIKLNSNESQFLWDGRDQHGDLVGSAVYLVAAHHPDRQNSVSKIAVIRN